MLKLQSVKTEKVSHEMLVLMFLRVLSGLWFSCGVAVSMGETANLSFSKFFEQVVMPFLRGRRGTL